LTPNITFFAQAQGIQRKTHITSKGRGCKRGIGQGRFYYSQKKKDQNKLHFRTCVTHLAILF